MLKSGLKKRNEASVRSQRLEELSQSLQASISPRIIELEDRTVRLSGSAEDQYAQWRELMADLYAAEMGELQGASEAQNPDNSASGLDSGQ